MNITLFNYIPLVTGIFSLSIAFVSYRKEAPFKLNRRFFSLSLSIAVWNLGLFVQDTIAVTDTVRLNAARISHLGAAFAAPTGLHFIVRFVRFGSTRWITPLKLSYLVSAIISILLFSGNLIIKDVVYYKYGTYSLWGSLYPVHIANIMAVYLLMLVLLIQAYRKSSSNVEKNRIHYILIGAIITILTTLCNFLPALGVPIKAPGHIGTLIFQAMILLSMYRYRLMNLRNAVSRTFFLLITWLVVGGGYVILFSLISYRNLESGTEKLLWHFLMAGVFVFFFFAIQKYLLPFIERRIYPLKADTKRLIEDLDKSLTISEQPRDAAISLVQTIYKATSVPVAAVYIRNNEAGALMRVAVMGNSEYNLPPEISETSPLSRDVLCKVLEEWKRDLATEQWEDKGKTGLIELIDAMERVHFEAVVPIETEGVLYGLLGFSRKRFGGVYDPEDLNTFRLLAARTALAIAIYASSTRIAAREHLAQIGEMTAMIAHEIKNPLGAIKAAAEHIRMNSGEAETNRLSLMIKEEVERLDTTIKIYLSFARPIPVNIERLDITRLTLRCAELFRNEANMTNFEMIVKRENPIMISVDPDAFRQLFFNLAKNSLEARHDGKMTISFIDNSEKLLVIFEDNCGGMSNEVVEKLFQPFHTTKPTGTGLGMAICKKIAVALNGKIYVDSVYGQGTTFSLELYKHKGDV